MRKPILFALVLTATFLLPIFAIAADKTWDGGGGTNLWSNPLNWSDDTLPGPTSRVVIGGGVTVHADTNATINGLSVNNIGTTLVVDAGATLTLSSPGSGIKFFVGSGGLLINNGIIDQLDGQLTVSDLTNNASGVINASDILSFSGVNHGQINASDSVYLGSSVDNYGVFKANDYVRYWGNAPDAFTNHLGATLSVTGWLQLGYAPDPSTRDAMFVNNGSVFADAQGFSHGMAIIANTTIVNAGSIDALDPIELSCGSDLIDSGTITGTILTTCHTWTGLGASDNWSEAANWSFLAPPASGGSSDIYLHSAAPINTDVNIDLGSGSTLLTTGTALTVSPGMTVQVSGQFDNDGIFNVLGTLQVNASGFVANEGLLDNYGVVDNSGDVSNGCTSGTIIQQPGSSWIGNPAWEACPHWDGGGGSNLWSNPLNWTSNVLPDYRSKPTIGGGASVHVNADTEVAGLKVEGVGTALTVDAGVTLTLSSPGSGIEFFVGSGGLLINSGIIDQLDGQLTVSDLTNNASGVINASDILSFSGVNHGQINASFHVYMGGSIDNHGQINVSGGKNIRYWGRAPDVFTNHPGATLSVTGWLQLGSHTNPDIDGSFVNQGVISITPGGFTHGNAITIDIYVLNAGTLTASPIQNDAVLQNECGAVITGTVNGNPVEQLPCNEPPVAEDDAYDAIEDTPLNIMAPGVLSNDSDPDGDPLTAVGDSTTSNGSLTLNGNGSFGYTPDQNYCGPDSFTYHANDGLVDSNIATVSIDVACVNDPPVATDNTYTKDEDTQLAGNVVTDDTGVGADSDVDGDGISINSHTDVAHGTLVVNPDGSFTYDPNPNYCGPDGFTYDITDNPPATPPPLISNTATVSITVNCVNDPPEVTRVDPTAQLTDYSDYIGTVTITVEDVDDTSTTLAESNEPPLSAGSLSLALTGCVVVPTESPAEDGSICTWTYDGQMLDPGDNSYEIVFTPSDPDGTGTTGTHTLTIQPEDAIVDLDDDNPVDLEVEEEGGNSGQFQLFFSAMEFNNPDDPNDGTAEFGDLKNAEGFITLIPVGPGGPISVACTLISPLPVYPAEGYGQVALFQCDFDDIPVNTYEVLAEVDGLTTKTIYYYGFDEGVLVIYDPSLGFITGGGWFLWPDSADPSLTACGPDGYAGDRTNIGFNFKYNKGKKKKPQGSLLLMRHTVDAACIDAGSYKVKSNALDGLSVGDGTDADGDYGWASVFGKATYREPSLDSEGNHTFLLYTEDHGEKGCNQDPADEFWIQVKDTDGVIAVEINGDDPAGPNTKTDGDDEPLECGNIIVPHGTGGKGKR